MGNKIISVFELRVAKPCVHFTKGGEHLNVKGVQFLSDDRIEFYCLSCIAHLKKMGFEQKKNCPYNGCPDPYTTRPLCALCYE